MKINPLLFVQQSWVMLVSITKVPLKKLILCSVLICCVIKRLETSRCLLTMQKKNNSYTFS